MINKGSSIIYHCQYYYYYSKTNKYSDMVNEPTLRGDLCCVRWSLEITVVSEPGITFTYKKGGVSKEKIRFNLGTVQEVKGTRKLLVITSDKNIFAIEYKLLPCTRSPATPTPIPKGKKTNPGVIARSYTPSDFSNNNKSICNFLPEKNHMYSIYLKII